MAAIVSLAVVAVLANHTSVLAMAEWAARRCSKLKVLQGQLEQALDLEHIPKHQSSPRLTEAVGLSASDGLDSLCFELRVHKSIISPGHGGGLRTGSRGL